MAKTRYYSLVRRELFPLIVGRQWRVLEVGCGDGATLQALKQLGVAAETWGIELYVPAARRAARRVDHLLQGDVESMKLPFQRGQFDVILLPDVLEHLREPWALLSRLRPFLRNNGQIIVSVPNLQHLSVLRTVFWQGEFDYQDAGIMDRTHLRWFTRRTIVSSLENAGYVVTQVVGQGGQLTWGKKLIDWFLGGRWQIMVTAQWIVVGRKSTKHRTKPLAVE